MSVDHCRTSVISKDWFYFRVKEILFSECSFENVIINQAIMIVCGACGSCRKFEVFNHMLLLCKAAHVIYVLAVFRPRYTRLDYIPIDKICLIFFILGYVKTTSGLPLDVESWGWATNDMYLEHVVFI